MSSSVVSNTVPWIAYRVDSALALQDVLDVTCASEEYNDAILEEINALHGTCIKRHSAMSVVTIKSEDGVHKGWIIPLEEAVTSWLITMPKQAQHSPFALPEGTFRDASVSTLVASEVFKPAGMGVPWFAPNQPAHNAAAFWDTPALVKPSRQQVSYMERTFFKSGKPWYNCGASIRESSSEMEQDLTGEGNDLTTHEDAVNFVKAWPVVSHQLAVQRHLFDAQWPHPDHNEIMGNAYPHWCLHHIQCQRNSMMCGVSELIKSVQACASSGGGHVGLEYRIVVHIKKAMGVKSTGVDAIKSVCNLVAQLFSSPPDGEIATNVLLSALQTRVTLMIMSPFAYTWNAKEICRDYRFKDIQLVHQKQFEFDWFHHSCVQPMLVVPAPMPAPTSGTNDSACAMSVDVENLQALVASSSIVTDSSKQGDTDLDAATVEWNESFETALAAFARVAFIGGVFSCPPPQSSSSDGDAVSVEETNYSLALGYLAESKGALPSLREDAVVTRLGASPGDIIHMQFMYPKLSKKLRRVEKSM